MIGKIECVMNCSSIDLQGLLTDSAWREGLILCMNMSCWNNYATACFPPSVHGENPQKFLGIRIFWFCINIFAVSLVKRTMHSMYY